MILRIDRLRVESIKGRAGGALVEDVSFEVAQGEVLGLIGESGAGKSTIGLAALGYVRPGCKVARGCVFFEDKDLFTLPQRELNRIRGNRLAYIAQSAAAMNPSLTLGYQVCEVPVRDGVMSAPVARRTAAELFRSLLLPDPDRFGERYPHQVSGGQLQRAMVAMAMICKPDLLVLDEPTTALDVTTQIEFLTIVRKLIAETGCSALYISHDLALVAQIANRIVVLRRGVVDEEGPTDAVLTRAKSPYARALVDARRTTKPRPPPRLDASTPILELRHVSARYRTGPLVIDDVTLALRPGETLAIVGESGSGKSTLARVFCGLLLPASGSVSYKGATIGAASARTREQRRAIQLVHQQPELALNPRERVQDAVGRPLELFFRMFRSAREAKVRELLKVVGLDPEFASRFPGQLSGGEKQRVCIARAIAAQPAVLICDEMTASLDALLAREILDLMTTLRQQLNMACIVITHDFTVVRSMADRVAVLLRGQVVEEGECDQIMQQPRTEYATRLLAAVPEMRIGWLDSMTSR